LLGASGLIGPAGDAVRRPGAGRPARSQPLPATHVASYMGGVAALPLALLMAITVTENIPKREWQ